MNLFKFLALTLYCKDKKSVSDWQNKLLEKIQVPKGIESIDKKIPIMSMISSPY